MNEYVGEEEELKSYIVPKNVKTRVEFFTGFGFKEVAIVLIAAAMGLCLGLLLLAITGSPISLGLFVPTSAFGFLVSKPNPRTGRSALDIIKDLRKYNARPKKYQYRYGSGRGN